MTALFADTALARRVEGAECELSMAVARAAQGRDGAEGLIFPVAGGAAVFVRPGSPMNKLIGAGFDGPGDAASLAAIEDAFRERAAPLLRLAREAGCELATVTTAPGSKSQENAMRRGFSLLYSRALLVKALR